MKRIEAPQKKVTVTLRVDEGDLAELAKIAQNLPRVRRTDVIRAAIKDFLRDNRPQNAIEGDKSA